MITEWGIRQPDGTVEPTKDEATANVLVKHLVGTVKVRREVTPWVSGTTPCLDLGHDWDDPRAPLATCRRCGLVRKDDGNGIRTYIQENS